MPETQRKVTDISTRRLLLRPMTPEFLEASLAGSRREAEELLGCTIAADWFEESAIARLRLDDLGADPLYQEWGLRAMIDRERGRTVGHLGFHTRPGPPYLAPWAPRGVELGFAVDPPFRRLGYAREAARGLVRWARTARGVEEFVATVAPDNTPSMSLVRSLGFVPIGRHQDEIDGEEIVLLLAGEPLRVLVESTPTGLA